MSIISAGNTTTTALVQTADTTGNLVFTTGGANTTALTLTNTQGATFAGAVTISGATTQTGNITTTGSIGAGTASPTEMLTVGSTTNRGNARVVCLDGNGLNLQTGGGSVGSGAAINFYDADTNYAGKIATYKSAGNTAALVFYTANGSAAFTERMKITSDGNLNVGASSGSPLRIYARSSTSDATSYTLYLDNAAGTPTFYVRGDGGILTGSATASPYNNTTGSAANMALDSNGFLYRSTSSLKYKHDVQDASFGLADVLKLRPVTYKAKNSGETVFGGLIAEEVDAAGLKEFVVYRDDDGTPDALHYGNMVSLCIKAIQELNAKVDAQAKRITDLEEQVLNLGTK